MFRPPPCSGVQSSSRPPPHGLFTWSPSQVDRGASKHQVKSLQRQFPQQPMNVAKKLAPAPSTILAKQLIQRMDGGTTRLIVVRHPFNRLVSAFRDKLERCHSVRKDGQCDLKKDYYYNRYGKLIVKKHRTSYLHRFNQTSLDKIHHYGAPYSVVRTDTMPTWWEFVQWLLSSATKAHRWDNHWMPTWSQCSPCTFRPNVILHFENLSEEEGWLKQELPGGERLVPTVRNQRGEKGVSADQLTAEYFSMLSHNDIEKLKKVYKKDFDMFGYTWPAK